MLRVKTIYKKIRKNLSYLKTAIRFRNLNYIFYNTLKDLNLNKKLFKEKNYDLKFVNKILNQNNIDFHSPETSWHYHIFAALSKNHKRLKILEIGTSKGEFSNFLSKIFNDSEIITIDLSEKHREFINNRHIGIKSYKSKNFMKERNKNLNRYNIKFIEMDSFNLINKFEKETFDLIFIDGDHLNPQVTIDVANSIYLLKKKGTVLCDDVLITDNTSKYSSNESFKTLDSLEKKGVIKNTFFMKRIYKYNAVRKKYISLSIKT